LDGKISEASQWSSPNTKTFSISTEKLGITEELEKLAKEILSQKKNPNRALTRHLDSNLPAINYFQAPKLDDAHRSAGLHLGDRFSHIPNEELEKEVKLRQTAWSACKLAEAFETTFQALNVIPKMSAIHSIQDRDIKIQQIADFVSYARKLATDHALGLTRKALSQKASIRFDALKRLHPPIIKERLLKSDLLQPTLFGEEEFKAADSMASQTVHFSERGRQQQRDYKPKFAQKRPQQSQDNTQRKKSRPYNPAPPSKDWSAGQRQGSSSSKQTTQNPQVRNTQQKRPDQSKAASNLQPQTQPQQARGNSYSWQRPRSPPNPFKKSSV